VTCLGCNIVFVVIVEGIKYGADGEVFLLCETCGHTMVSNGRGGVRDLTRAEWKSLSEKSWFELWKDTREKIVERMIG
jgi:hypothetical protein